jgi:hypothetical protein
MLSQSLLRKIAKKMADNPIIGTVCSEWKPLALNDPYHCEDLNCRCYDEI